MKRFLSIALFSSFPVLVFGQTFTPTDEGSKIRFVIKNFGINTGGTFQGLQGTITYNPANPVTANFEVSVDANTIDTDIESRDNHLRKAEYFNVKEYPRLSFKSTRITKTNKTDYLFMFGTITIKGVAKDISFPFKVTAKDGGYLFEGDFKLNRRDFNVGGRSLSLSDELNVELSVFAKKS